MGIISEFRGDDFGHSLLATSVKTKRELQTLLHPEMLGRAFQVLLLEKKAAHSVTQLTGFKFAREPRPYAKTKQVITLRSCDSCLHVQASRVACMCDSF